MVVAGISAVWYVFSGNLTAYSSASIVANVKGSYNGTHAILEITIRNTGGTAVELTDIKVDGKSGIISINDLMDSTNHYLAPGSSIQKVLVKSGTEIGPGNHILTIEYTEHGSIKETYVEFAI